MTWGGWCYNFPFHLTIAEKLFEFLSIFRLTFKFVLKCRFIISASLNMATVLPSKKGDEKVELKAFPLHHFRGMEVVTVSCSFSMPLSFPPPPPPSLPSLNSLFVRVAARLFVVVVVAVVAAFCLSLLALLRSQRLSRFADLGVVRPHFV